MSAVFGTLGLVAFGLAMLGLGLLILVAALRTLRGETLPRFVEARPGMVDMLLTVLGSLGPQLLVALFALAAGLRSLQVALLGAGA